MSLWTDLGFRHNPYETSPVPATAEGNELLVGREEEINKLILALTSTDTHPTIEGANGVGKSSLVAVAAYRMMASAMEGSSPQVFVPIEKYFQIDGSGSPEQLEREVLLQVAQSFIDRADLLHSLNINTPEVARVDDWLNSPTFRSFSAGAVVSLGGGKQANESAGFDESGFRHAVRSWLEEAFPSRESGGFVCTIDNLELLVTSKAARSMLEAIRDTVLSFPGLRWVLCGANGIVRSSASSARLQGVLADPIDLAPLDHDSVPDVLARRLSVFAMDPGAYAPVEPDGFDHIYLVMHRNLRNAMKTCQDFAIWMATEHEDHPEDSDGKRQLLEVYLANLSELYSEETRMPPRAWQVFDHLVAIGGSTSPGDFDEFGFESGPAMRPHVKALEDANLVSSTIDEDDSRRRTIVISPRGWFVQYHRSGFELPTS